MIVELGGFVECDLVIDLFIVNCEFSVLIVLFCC